MLNLDAHILLFALDGSLTKRERELLSQNGWGVSGIVLWEIAKLKQLGLIEIDVSDPLVADVLSRVHVWPIDLEIALTSMELDFEGDPADQLIAATSIVHDVPLVTRDRAIRRSRIVPLAG